MTKRAAHRHGCAVTVMDSLFVASAAVLVVRGVEGGGGLVVGRVLMVTLLHADDELCSSV
jgi:hypothetical protein